MADWTDAVTPVEPLNFCACADSDGRSIEVRLPGDAVSPLVYAACSKCGRLPQPAPDPVPGYMPR